MSHVLLMGTEQAPWSERWLKAQEARINTSKSGLRGKRFQSWRGKSTLHTPRAHVNHVTMLPFLPRDSDDVSEQPDQVWRCSEGAVLGGGGARRGRVGGEAVTDVSPRSAFTTLPRPHPTPAPGHLVSPGSVSWKDWQ